MAEIIPALNRTTLNRMTSGEKRLARRLESLLEDDYLVWYDIPVGRLRRYPDFIILHPLRGLLFLEVKDWVPSTLKKINKTDVTLLTDNGLVRKPHPLDQARQCTYSVLNKLAGDPILCHQSGKHKGNLIMPYGWGVVFTNITRKQMQKALPDDRRESLLPDHLVIYKNEITQSADAEVFQKQLWGMFNYQFGNTLTLPEIDRVRWHLFPEVRIDDDSQWELFDDGAKDDALPDIIKILDIQQEQLARSMGEGHRVIHGVAGSGKTLILGYRCLHLSQATTKPILVLCFNVTLAARLRSFISSKGIEGQVQVYHFHDWCEQQLTTYHVDLIQSDKPTYERQVESVIQAVEKGQIPRAQYGALLIDEGHDFEADWLRLVAQMIDPENDSLLLLYDDAQSIYKSRAGLGFSLSSVGIQAQGRTTILRLNYRNTREILHFSYAFARHYLNPHSTDEDHIPLIEPEAAGNSGPTPEVRQFDQFRDEVAYTIKCLKQWHNNGVSWGDIAVLSVNKWQGKELSKQLKQAGIPHLLTDSKQHKKDYDPAIDKVTVTTIHSSKGLEFQRVIIPGVGQMKDSDDRKLENARLLYVGMTRAKECLLMTTSDENEFSKRLLRIPKELAA